MTYRNEILRTSLVTAIAVLATYSYCNYYGEVGVQRRKAIEYQSKAAFTIQVQEHAIRTSKAVSKDIIRMQGLTMDRHDFYRKMGELLISDPNSSPISNNVGKYFVDTSKGIDEKL